MFILKDIKKINSVAFKDLLVKLTYDKINIVE